MSIKNTVKHVAISATTALSPISPNTSGSLGKILNTIKDIAAELGVSESVTRQLVGIEQTINSQLIDLGPFAARQAINNFPGRTIESSDCSIYDAKPTAEMRSRSGALVFIEYLSTTGSGKMYDGDRITLDPIVHFIGFGETPQMAWKQAQLLPSLKSGGQGIWQKERSYILWYRFVAGKIEKSKTPYPFYLSIISSK